jgi:hypothetical protein
LKFKLLIAGLWDRPISGRFILVSFEIRTTVEGDWKRNINGIGLIWIGISSIEIVEVTFSPQNEKPRFGYHRVGEPIHLSLH